MDFSLSEEQEALRESVQRYSRAAPKDANGSRGGKHWAAFAELGWLGVLLPEESGGSGGSLVDASILLEEFGHSLVAEPFLPCAVAAVVALRHCSGSERVPALLKQIGSGELIVVVAHGEAGTRDDPELVSSTARREPDGAFVLNGRKSFVLSGPHAHAYLVPAQLSGETALFLVERGAPGLQCRDFETLDGRGGSELLLQNLRLDERALLTAPGEGASALRAATEHAIAGLCAEAIGAMDDVIQVTAEYLKTRRAYGTTLSTFQALQHRLADMLVELELSRSIFYRLLAAFSQDDPLVRRRAVSAAKALIGTSARLVAAGGIQLHGGMGMVDEYVIGRHFKQVTALEMLFGNPDHHWKKCAALSFAPSPIQVLQRETQS